MYANPPKSQSCKTRKYVQVIYFNSQFSDNCFAIIIIWPNQLTTLKSNLVKSTFCLEENLRHGIRQQIDRVII